MRTVGIKYAFLSNTLCFLSNVFTTFNVVLTKVWDAVDRLLFASQAFEYPITGLAWAPDGSNFGVGSYNTIRLCDSAGVCIVA